MAIFGYSSHEKRVPNPPDFSNFLYKLKCSSCSSTEHWTPDNGHQLLNVILMILLFEKWSCQETEAKSYYLRRQDITRNIKKKTTEKWNEQTKRDNDY